MRHRLLFDQDSCSDLIIAYSIPIDMYRKFDYAIKKIIDS